MTSEGTPYGATKRPRLANRRNKVGASGCSPSSLRECPTLCASSHSRPLAGWVNRHQEDVIDYLREENRVLREQLGPRPLRLTDAQRRRLAVRGQKLGRRILAQVAGIVTSDTILRVFFVIELETRRVTIAGIHPQPYGAWMEQLARNLTDPVEGCLRTASHLIHDRDLLDTRVFGEILTGGGVQPIRLPPKSPNLNAYAERFVRSIKGVSQSRGPAWRGSCTPARPRVRRTLPSREKPSGPRQPTPAATATSGQPGRRR